MSTEKKRIAVNWALGLASGILVLCAGWMGKTAMNLSTAQAAQEVWNKAQPAAVEAAIASHDDKLHKHIDERFDRLEQMLHDHISKTP